MPDADESLPRLLGGRYRLEAKLGSGGMGVVYRAVDTTMQRQVAVKLIRGVDGVALDEEVAGRFLREAKNTARIQHENIIEVYDLGRSEAGDMFFVMELLEGESLSARLRRETKLSAERGVHVVRQMCAALHVAHAAGIIHRDLKPANVMLIKRAGDGDYVKVLDFGVAKSYAPDQQTELTHTGMLVGTVEYMAPEQIMGRKVDGRTDIYALGVVMYRLFSGKTPFRDGGVPALIHAHLNVMPKPMNERDAKVPGELDRVVLRCLAKRPEQRYESMEELSRALAAAMEPAGLVNLDFAAGDDDYTAGDKTEVARPPQTTPHPSSRAPTAPRAPHPSSSAPPVSAVPSTRPASSIAPLTRPAPSVPTRPSTPRDELLDDATIRMDRNTGRGDVSSAVSKKPNPYGVPELAGDEGMDRTEIMRPGTEPQHEDLSTAKRPIPDDITRVDATSPRECAMCKTMNSPHARACSACGVSLSTTEQEAVRARVSAPRPVHAPAPHMPPPNTGGYPNVGNIVPSPPGGAPLAHASPSPMQGAPMQGAPPGFQNPPPPIAPVGPRPPLPSHHGPANMSQSGSVHSLSSSWGSLPQQPPPPKSAWERFLSWTGLRR